MAKSIEEQDTKTLRAASKSINESGLLPDGAKKLRVIGVTNQHLVDEIVDAIETKIDAEAQLPGPAADWYNWHFADEFGGEDEQTKEGTGTTQEDQQEEETATEEQGEVEPEETQEVGEEATDSVDDQEDREVVESETRVDDLGDPGGEHEATGKATVDGIVWFKTKQALEALKLAKAGLAKTSLIEDRLRAIFTGEEMRTYNGHVCITQPFFTDFKCSVRVVDLINVLSKVEADEFSMEITRKKKIKYLNVKTEDGFDAGFNTIREQSFADKAEDIVFSGPWKKTPEDLTVGLDLVRTSADRGAFGPLSCVYINGSDLVATDRNRLSHYVMTSSMGKFMIRADVADELVKFSVKFFSFDSDWIHFRTEDQVVFSTKLVIGKFINYKPNINKAEQADDICEIPKKLSKDIKAISAMGTHVDIKIQNGQLEMNTSGNRGWATKNIEIDHNEDVKLRANPTLLMSALRQGVVMMAIIPDLAIVLRTDRFTHCIAVMV